MKIFIHLAPAGAGAGFNELKLLYELFISRATMYKVLDGQQKLVG